MPAPLAHILNPIDVSPSQATVRFVQHEGQKMSESSASLVSYKRVPKACTQCRRDKSRCDRGRPCDGCVRKGRVNSCLDGCVACRQARLSCDESRPCISCVQDGRQCIEDNASAIAASRKAQQIPPTALALPRRIKPHPRIDIPAPQTCIELACSACQRDNKKCTGGIRCCRCAEIGEHCHYVSQPPKLVKQRCALCRKKNKKCEQARPCEHCVKAQVPCVDLPRKGVGRGLRVKRACAGCRADKIQCEEVRPCGGCKKKRIECVERGCNACLAKGSKCASCTRQDHSHGEECETSSTTSYSEEENDNLSSPFPSSPASPLPRHVLPLEAQRADKRQAPSHSPLHDPESRYASAVALSNTHRLPGFNSSHPYNMRRNYLSAPVHPMHPELRPLPLTYMAELPPFSVGFSSVSLSASTSDMRTRQISDVSED